LPTRALRLTHAQNMQKKKFVFAYVVTTNTRHADFTRGTRRHRYHEFFETLACVLNTAFLEHLRQLIIGRVSQAVTSGPQPNRPKHQAFGKGEVVQGPRREGLPVYRKIGIHLDALLARPRDLKLIIIMSCICNT
jgi:hypothetical protein